MRPLFIIEVREGGFVMPDGIRVDRLLATEERLANGSVPERVYILLVEELMVGAVANHVRHLA